MAKPEPDAVPLPSVLDRLIDLDPQARTEAAPGRSKRLAQVREAVKRDLEWLLNSKQLVGSRGEGLPHLETSVVAYGLPDFTAASLAAASDRARLLRSIEQAVARFEPRLSRVRVSLEDDRTSERTLRFHIEAMLYVEPEPEPVAFDSVLELSTRAFVIRDV